MFVFKVIFHLSYLIATLAKPLSHDSISNDQVPNVTGKQGYEQS